MTHFIIPNDQIIHQIATSLNDNENLRRWVGNVNLGRIMLDWTDICRGRPLQIDQLFATKEVRVTFLSPLGLFGKLSQTILLCIVDLLPVDDVISLQEATHSLILAIKIRLDACEYLRRAGVFTETPQLLDVMARHGAVLYGPKALEWFIPGSITEEASWQFLVPPNPGSIVALKHALELSGVTFQTCLTKASRELNTGSVILDRHQILSISQEDLKYRTELETSILKAVDKTFPQLRNKVCSQVQIEHLNKTVDVEAITITKDGPLITVTRPSCKRSSTSVIFGTLTKNGRIVQIQLAFRSAKHSNQLYGPTVLPSIFDTDASYFQCFLTKEAAGHMYYELAKERKGYQWQGSKIGKERLEVDIQGEGDGSWGFEFLEIPFNQKDRTLVDRYGLLVGLQEKFREDNFLAILEDLRWCHQQGRPVICDGVIESEVWTELVQFGVVR